MLIVSLSGEGAAAGEAIGEAAVLSDAGPAELCAGPKAGAVSSEDVGSAAGAAAGPADGLAAGLAAVFDTGAAAVSGPEAARGETAGAAAGGAVEIIGYTCM